MNTKHITVTAFVKTKPGREHQMREDLLSLVAPSRKDEGCILYELHQGQEHPGHFYFHETWTTKDCLDQHIKKRGDVLERVFAMTSEPPEITVWEKISPEPV